MSSKSSNVDRFFMPVHFFVSDELSSKIEPSFRFIEGNVEVGLSELESSNGLNKELVKRVKYKLNNNGHRSDNFKELDKNQVNVLFAGCSVTFGEYLPEKYAWPNHVYDLIKSEYEAIGPLHVLAYPGGNAFKIISNIFKYVKNYGAPDYIFLLLPDMFRLYIPYEDGCGFSPIITYSANEPLEESAKPFRGFYEFQAMYRILETMCELLNIKLISTSWDDLANEKMNNLSFKSYKIIEEGNLLDIAEKSGIKYSDHDKDFFIYGADELHPGLISHLSLVTHFIERFRDDKKD